MHDIILINPPLCEPTVPLLGPYQLAGYAKKISLDMKVIDFNNEFIKHIINTANIPSSNYEDNPKKDFEVNTCRAFLKGNNITSYNDVLALLKKCSSIKDYWSIIDYIRACYDMYSLRFSGIRFRLDGFDTKYRWNIWDDIKKFVDKYEDSKLFELIEKWVLSYKVCETEKKIVGINITFESQLFFSMLFCIAIRKHFKDAIIIIGGGFVNSFINSSDSIGPIDEYCDLVVSGEGEAFLWRLKNTLLYDFKKIKEFATFSGKRAYYASASDLCDKSLRPTPPDFDAKSLSAYPSPSRVIPLRFTYQCYWGKCKFCSDKEPHACFESEYEFDEILNYCIEGKKNRIFDCIYFLDSAIPPRILEKFCNKVIESGEQIKWGTNVRADNPFTNESFIKKLSLAGCVFVKFGLESGSQRVLNLMNKGTNINNAAKFINLCRKYGIYVHSYVMFAYPGESKEDRRETCNFLLSEYSHPDNYNCSEFILYGKAPIAQELDYSFDEDHSETGWHSASYSFTNDEVKRDITLLRKRFDYKYKPASVLISTGHTIAYSKKISDRSVRAIRIYEDTYVKLSKYVVQDIIDNTIYIGRWRRRDGIVYIKGNDAKIILEKIINRTVREIISLGITSNTIFNLIDKGIIEAINGNSSKQINYTGEQQIMFFYGNELTKNKWYGFYDAT